MALPVWSNQQIINNLLRGDAQWYGSTVTFGFPKSAESWSWGKEGTGFSPFSTDQKAAARLALSLWDDLAAVDFKETTSNPQITFQNTTTKIYYAHAYFPGSYGAAGSVWFNPTYDSGTSDLKTPEVGDWGFKSYIHEIGHALGLEHPGNYTASSTYANSARYQQDSIMYTIMSYFEADQTGADWVASDGREYFAQTPMIHDVLAIQALYGVERNTRAADTVYGFNSTANRSVFDFTENKHPILCIWDAGGTDTLDLSGFNTRSRIDLRAGQFSDCDGMTKNIAIAFGAIIENAEGGGASDSILGNTGRNELHGNGGADTINGSGGGDTIFGGGGNDRIIGGNGGDRLYGGAGADTFVFTNLVTAYDVIKDFEDGTDSIVIDTDAASRVGDLTITGQGTESVRVEIGGAVIVVKSDSSIFLGHADFTFA